MDKIIINIINIFIDIILSSVLNFEKVYGCKYCNIKLLENYYVKLPYKNINIVKYCSIGAKTLKDKRIFYFCCFKDFNINNKENGYVIPLMDLDKISKKYNIIFIPQIENVEDGFLFISDELCIEDKEEIYTISAEGLINKYNKDFREYFNHL